MEAVSEQALGIVEEARRNGGLASLFVTVFPALLLLEVPLNLLVLLGVLVLDGRLRQALARHQRALKYSRFQPGNKGGKQVARFPERKSKEVA